MIKKLSIILSSILLAIILIYSVSNIAFSPESNQPPAANSNRRVEPPISPTQTNLQLQNELDKLNIESKSYLIYQEDSGRILASLSPDNPVSIASLTKLMTALVIIEDTDISDTFTITSSGVLNISPSLNVRVGDSVEVVDLVKSILVGSANDAALSLGVYYESKTGKSITQGMVEKAKLLNMNATHYNNPIGFDSDTNYSTANDLQKLVDYIRRYPIFEEVSRMNSYSFTSKYNSYSVEATNKLVKQYTDIEAVKTGFTDDANGAMIIKLKTEPKVVIIVLNSGQRETDVLLIRNQVGKLYNQVQE